MVITHDQEFAARVGDKYAVLEEGRITVTGASWEVFLERPAYAPLLWRATEDMDLAPAQRPLVPQDLVISGTGIRGGGAW